MPDPLKPADLPSLMHLGVILMLSRVISRCHASTAVMVQVSPHAYQVIHSAAVSILHSQRYVDPYWLASTKYTTYLYTCIDGWTDFRNVSVQLHFAGARVNDDTMTT